MGLNLLIYRYIVNSLSFLPKIFNEIKPFYHKKKNEDWLTINDHITYADLTLKFLGLARSPI